MRDMTRTINKLLDKVTWDILLALYQRKEGMRFNEICRVVEATNPVISDRMKILKSHDLIRVIVGTDEHTERNYFIHVLSPTAVRIIKEHGLVRLMKELQNLEATR